MVFEVGRRETRGTAKKAESESAKAQQTPVLEIGCYPATMESKIWKNYANLNFSDLFSKPSAL